MLNLFSFQMTKVNFKPQTQLKFRNNANKLHFYTSIDMLSDRNARVLNI